MVIVFRKLLNLFLPILLIEIVLDNLMRRHIALDFLLRNHLNIQLFLLILFRNLPFLLFIYLQFNIILILQQITIDINIEMICLDQFLLLISDILQTTNHLLLNLQINLQLNILQLQNMILYYNLQKIPVLLRTNTTIHLLTNGLRVLHTLN